MVCLRHTIEALRHVLRHVRAVPECDQEPMVVVDVQLTLCYSSNTRAPVRRAAGATKLCACAHVCCLLSQEETDIGIVTAIAAPAAFEVKFFGDGGHAGAQLMFLR